MSSLDQASAVQDYFELYSNVHDVDQEHMSRTKGGSCVDTWYM